MTVLADGELLTVHTVGVAELRVTVKPGAEVVAGGTTVPKVIALLVIVANVIVCVV